MEDLWRGWYFAVIDMKKLRYIWMRHYHPVVIHVCCLPLKFSAGFVIPDAIEYNLILNMLHKICILISSP